VLPCEPIRIIVLGGVLDVERKLRFLDTPEKLQMYERYQMEGRDRLGTWWEKDFARDVCKELGLRSALRTLAIIASNCGLE
jgi:hypothetical protein